MAVSFKSGFTLSEALVSIALLGVLASLLIPAMSTNVGKEKLMGVGKQTATEIGRAYAIYSKNQFPTEETTSAEIMDNVGYVRKILDGSQSVQLSGLEDRAATETYTCSEETQCLLLQNGGILMYSPEATFGATLSNAAMRFLLDPDGSGPHTGIVFLLYFRGRVSTQTLSPEAILSDGDWLPDQVNDPDYIEDWTDG